MGCTKIIYDLLPEKLFMGYGEEQLSRTLTFDISQMQAELPGGVPMIAYMRPRDELGYLASGVTLEGSMLTWELSAHVMQYKGIGGAQIVLVDESGEETHILKSHVMQMLIGSSIPLTGGEPPEPWETWLEQILAAAARAESAAADAEAQADRAETAEAGAQQALIDAGSPVLYGRAQTLTDVQQQTARGNIAAASAADVSDLKSDTNIALTAAEKTAFVASKYGTSDLNILAMDSHAYTPDRTSNWQEGGYLVFSHLAITEGMGFHVGRFSGDCFGNQPCNISFYDGTGTKLSDKIVARSSLNEIGGFDAKYTAPEGTSYVDVRFSIISNASSHQLPTVGERYHMIWCYVYTGTGKLQISYDMLTDQAKQFSLILGGTATQAKLPNYDTVNRTLTVYKRTRLLSHAGTEISMLSEDLVLPATETSQNNVFVYNTNTNTYALMRAGANLSGSPYIVLGEININNGLGNIQCGYTIDGYPVGSEKLLSDMENLNLPTQWNDVVQTIQTAQGIKFCFAIQTDTHISSENSVSSANNLKALTQFVGFDFVAILGDVIRGYANETIDSPSAMRTAMTEIMHRYVTGISCPLMIAMGNHDTNKMWADAFGGEPFSLAEVWGREFKPAFNTNPKAVTKTGFMYYYTDFDDVRVIVLNTQDGGNGAFGIGQTQIDWLTNTALNTDKAVLVLSHVPLVDGWSISSNYVSSYANAVSAIKAFQTNGGTVIGCMSGHTHTQESKTVDGILYVTFTNGADKCEVAMVDLDAKTINTIPVGFTGAGNRSFTFA